MYSFFHIESTLIYHTSFNLPTKDERTLYCQYWHRKLLNRPLVAFPEELSPLIAELTDGFSFAYLKELFITSLLVLARGGMSEDEGPPASSDHSSTTDTVIVEAPVEEAAERESSTGKDKESDKTTVYQKPKAKKIIPKIDIPEELQGNPLLAIIMTQAQVLLDEMDNSQL